jgi:hypothetical protein
MNGVFVAPFAVLSEFNPFGVFLGVFGGEVVSPFALGASQSDVNPFGRHPFSPLLLFLYFPPL